MSLAVQTLFHLLNSSSLRLWHCQRMKAGDTLCWQPLRRQPGWKTGDLMRMVTVPLWGRDVVCIILNSVLVTLSRKTNRSWSYKLKEQGYDTEILRLSTARTARSHQGRRGRTKGESTVSDLGFPPAGRRSSFQKTTLENKQWMQRLQPHLF